jgi:hypothetical protein
MSVKKNTINSIQLLKENGIEKAIKTIFPVKFVSNHVSKHVRSNSWFFIIGGTFYLFSKFLFIKKKRFQINTKYHVLFYVPNNKYKKFADALTKNISFSYLIISEEIYENNVVSVDDYRLLNANNYPLKLLKVIFRLFIYSLNTKQLSDFKKHYWNILSLVRRDLLAEALFKNVHFDKYFSFHPNEGFHQVIQIFYKEMFNKTYAIRPTTTSMAKEHQFISTDNLFYKTEDELNIFQCSNLNGVKLIKGGLIADNKAIEKDLARNAILFLDTCTNVNPESVRIRRKATEQFLQYASKLNVTVLFKFHPALINSELKRTKEKINSLASPNIKILNDNIPWEKIGLAIGFDTTLFYECFLNKIPVLSFRDEYYLFPNPINEFTNSPVTAINNESDFELISRLLNDKVFLNNKQNEQYQWFSEQYNYPDGMNTIKQILAE